MSSSAVIRIYLFLVLLVIVYSRPNSGNTTILTSYAKVSRSGSSIFKDNNERGVIAGQKLWTQSSAAHISRKQPSASRISPPHFPEYRIVKPKRISDKVDQMSDDKIPSKGEVVIQNRFTNSRPFFGYDDPPIKKPEYQYPSPSIPSQDSFPPLLKPPPESFNQSLNIPSGNDSPSDPYNSPYDSYSPPNNNPSYSHPKPPDMIKSVPKPGILYLPPAGPPVSNDGPPKNNGDKPDMPPDMKPPSFPPGTPAYLDYNPYEHKHNHDHGPSEPEPPSDHDHLNHHHDDSPPITPTVNGPDLTGPDDHYHDHPPPDLHSYHAHPHPPHRPSDSFDDNKSLPPSAPSSGPSSPGNTGPKFPEYLDHDPYIHAYNFGHDFYHHDHPPIYHEVKPPMTTPMPEDTRLNKKPYSYYYLGRKLWYIPLYFSVYFIVYIFVLILKSIARHKITFSQYFEENRSMKTMDQDNVNTLADHILKGIDQAHIKYST